MSYGLDIIAVLVSPTAISVAVILLLFSAWLLLSKRKTITAPLKAFAAFVLLVSILYLAFIIWMVISFGQH